MSSKIFVCAEAGHNGNGNMRLNKLIMKEAKACGADAVKFQLYDTNKIKRPWQSTYFELLFAELTKEDLIELKAYADEIGIEFMASAFDTERVRWLEEIGVKRHKLASRSIKDAETIKAMEKTKKPIIASLGAWNDIVPPKIKNAQLLYCVAEYPAYITEEMFPSKFGEDEAYQGFSDHTIGMYWAREAVKRGATIIEKHFTISKDLPGKNQKGSCNPGELKEFITYVRQIERGISF
jgi:sialic acid synthase SpsE